VLWGTTGTSTVSASTRWLYPSCCLTGCCFVGCPGHARTAIRIDPRTKTAITFGAGVLDGPELKAVNGGETKWLRCYFSPADNSIYGVPAHADCVIRIDPTTLVEEDGVMVPTVTLLRAEPGSATERQLQGRWKFHGGVVGADGHVYCVPCNSSAVLKIDTQTHTLSTFGDEAMMTGAQKWYGGLVAGDGHVYCIPQNADSVLKIDLVKQQTFLIAQGMFGQGEHKWHGGTYSARDGCIYGFPNNAEKVLRIDPAARGGEGAATLLGDKTIIVGGAHRTDGKYKYDGGVVGSDGCIYCIPGDADRTLKITPGPSPGSDEGVALELVGMSFADGNPSDGRCQGKWQNGFLGSDDCIYAIPLKVRRRTAMGTRRAQRSRARSAVVPRSPVALSAVALSAVARSTTALTPGRSSPPPFPPA
jgi:hypothetical protein